jgi:hypothetical protein
MLSDMPAAPDHRPSTSRLPPPPAPVARDANPWHVSSRAGEPVRRRTAARGPTNQPLPPPAPPGGARHGLARFVPIAIFLAVLGSIASGAFEALRRGDRLAAIVPLIVVGIVALGMWRNIKRSQQR